MAYIPVHIVNSGETPDNLFQITTKINAEMDQIAAEFAAIAEPVLAIYTALTGVGGLNQVDGTTLVDGSRAMVVIGTNPAAVSFYAVDADSGLDEDLPRIVAPLNNAGDKRWVLAGTLRTTWFKSAEPTVNDDASAGYRAGDAWIYGGNVWVCTDATVGAASWPNQILDHLAAYDHDAYDDHLEAAAPHSGHATLVAGKIPTNQLPAIAITDTFPVDSTDDMLELDAQVGDVALVHDPEDPEGVGQVFILAAEPASMLANWKAWLYPTGGVSSVDGRTGVVTLADLYLAVAQKGAASGVASLNAQQKAVEEPASKGAASGVASLNADTKVVENPANATATPTEAKIPIAGTGGKVAAGWLPDATDAAKGAIQLAGDLGGTAASPKALLYEDRQFTIDGGASAIAAGAKSMMIHFSYACDIAAVDLRSADNTSGSIALDFWVAPYDDFPASVADSICASDKPGISSGVKSHKTSFTGWMLSIAAGSDLEVNVDSCTDIKKCVGNIRVKRT